MRKWIAAVLSVLFLLPLAASAEASDPVPFRPAEAIGETAPELWLKDAAARADFSALLWRSYTSSLPDPSAPPAEADLADSASYVGRSGSMMILMIPSKDGRALYLRYDAAAKTADYVVMPAQELDRHETDFLAACPQAWKNKADAVQAALAPKKDPAKAPSAVGVWTSGKIATLTINRNGTGRLEFANGAGFNFSWTQEGETLTLSQKGAKPITGIVKEHSLSLTISQSTMSFRR